MINSFPFFRFPFYPYPHNYSNYKNNNRTAYQKTSNINSSTYAEVKNDGNLTNNNYTDNNCANHDNKTQREKKSSIYSSIGPILINTNGFSNKEEPLIEISGLKLYLDDLIILSLLFFLYKEDVKDDMLFIILILLLIT